MMPKFKGKTKPKIHKPSMETVMRWMVTLLLGFVVLLPVFAGVTQYEQNRAKADVEDVLAFMQTSCRKYDNYRLANTTEALQDVLTKVKTLTAYRYEEEDALLNEKRLQHYAKFQYLTGIFVLDENFSVLAHCDKAGKDESLLLSQIIGDKNAADILNYPQKTYADQICINDNTYNYAISARQDKPGLVICYTDITRFQNDKNELSLSTMLDAEMFRQDVTVVITDGLRSILREDPDVILIGEMRDLNTIETALTAAETGHLVFATLHTNSAADSVDRMVNVFPEGQQRQIRLQLSTTLRAVLSQQLLPKRAGGRAAACEVMMVNSAIKNLIREGKTPQIDSFITMNAQDGSITMDNALLKMVREGTVTYETALGYARDREAFSKGRRG